MLRAHQLNNYLRNAFTLFPFTRTNTASSSSSLRTYLPGATASASSKSINNSSGPRKRPRPSMVKQHQHVCFSTYVSKYFIPAPGEVESFLDRHKVKYRRSSEAKVRIEECPFCHPIKGQPDNLYAMSVNRISGGFRCYRCGKNGHWFDLKKKYSAGIVSPMFPDDEELMPRESLTSARPATQEKKPEMKPQPESNSQQSFVRNLWNTEDPAARSYLNQKRHLKDEVLKKYGVGCGRFDIIAGRDWRSKERCLTFPMYDGNGKLVRHKIRPVETKSGMRLLPKGGNWGFFGLDTVPADAKSVVLTEGEFDAMSVYQSTGRPAISVPNGASSLPLELLPYLERFERIYLWMDEDGPGQTGAETFSRKLGIRRCLSVRGFHAGNKPCKDANDGIQRGLDLEALIKKAEVIQHSGLVRFQDIRDQVLADLNNIQDPNVVKSQSIPRLHELMKGLRPGELTILSGPTGCGKTTLLSQLSLDYCVQQVPTLWGSFEMENARLAGKLLWQYHAVYNRHKTSLVDAFDYWADRFSELPFYFMRYHGSNPVEQVIETMDFAHYRYDCRHVVLDNLQFMSYGQRGGIHQRQFEVMDSAVAQLREFTTRRKVHVTLVVHPRKTEDDDKLQIASVYGSAKATQEADNVLILQTTNEGRMLEIKKNRFDGSVGGIPLKFDKKRLMFSQGDSCGAWLGWESEKKESDDSKIIERYADKVAKAVKQGGLEVDIVEQKEVGKQRSWEDTNEDNDKKAVEYKEDKTLESADKVARAVKQRGLQADIAEDKECGKQGMSVDSCEDNGAKGVEYKEDRITKSESKRKDAPVELRKIKTWKYRRNRTQKKQARVEGNEDTFGGWEGMGRRGSSDEKFSLSSS